MSAIHRGFTAVKTQLNKLNSTSPHLKQLAMASNRSSNSYETSYEAIKSKLNDHVCYNGRPLLFNPTKKALKDLSPQHVIVITDPRAITEIRDKSKIGDTHVVAFAQSTWERNLYTHALRMNNADVILT